MLCLLMLFAAGNYIFKYPEIRGVFVELGYPPYLIYPLAIAKIFGVIAILTDKSKTLKELAYAGFFFNFVLALSAHIAVGDGQFAPAIVALILLLISYALDKRIPRDHGRRKYLRR
jgi:apolipoprotein N-acyltransferase